MDQFVENLLSKMTLEEKIGQMLCLSARQTILKTKSYVNKKNLGCMLNVIGREETNELQSHVKNNTRLGIPLLFGIDAVHGHALYPGATIFPTQLGLSCSWNPDLLESIGEVTAKECRATGVHWTYSPVCDIARDLRWGRINETFGEDPYLSSVLVKSIVTGYEGPSRDIHTRILSCGKHFAGYSLTVGGRDATEAELSRRHLRTTFFPPFKAAVDSGCSTIMTAYISIDGVPATVNSWLLTDVLRTEWGFAGFVVTDYANIKRLETDQFVREDMIQASSESVLSGNDMMMGSSHFYEDAQEAVRRGLLDVSAVDRACRRILTAKYRVGLFDHPLTDGTAEASLGCPAHLAVAFEAACQSSVLLKNDGGILPLQRENMKRVAVIGPNADSVLDLLGDWTAGGRWTPGNRELDRKSIKTVLDGIRDMTSGSSIRVDYCPGCDVTASSVQPEDLRDAVEMAKGADVAIMVLGDAMLWNGEQRDRANLDLPKGQQDLLLAIHKTQTPIILILVCGRPNSIPWAAETIPAILVSFNPGMQGGTAIASLLFGDRTPSGRLSVSWPRHVGQLPVFYNQLPGWHAEKYVDMSAKPQWCFGFGLTYTTFLYSNLKVNKEKLKMGESLMVTVDVKNTGQREGKETVQLYIKHKFTSVTVPVKSLALFRQVQLAIEETKSVEFEITHQSLVIVDRDLKSVVEPGVVVVMVGPNSDTLESVNFQVL